MDTGVWLLAHDLMNHDLWILVLTAGSIGVVHTLLGPDHYLPFVAMSRARDWSVPRTLTITIACGIGHVLSSVVLGFLGIAFGVGVFKLESVESARGSLAGWLMLAFGLAYLVWGVRRAIKNKPHTHWHAHEDGLVHEHEHVHSNEHAHAHDTISAPSLTPWVLFTIFVFGPCEPLIPLVMYPAAEGSLWSVILVTFVFAVSTIGTMTAVVLLGTVGVSKLANPLARFERYGHALAGFVVLACGTGIKLGL